MAKREARERTTALLAEPERFEDLCDHIANGGTLYEYTATNRLLYRMTWEWISTDPDRLFQYQRALQCREAALQDEVREGLRRVALADPRHAFTPGGDVKGIYDMPDDVVMAMSSFEVTTNKDGDQTTKVKLNDRMQGLGLLGRSAGIFKDRVELSGQNGGPVEVSSVNLRGLSDEDLQQIKQTLLRTLTAREPLTIDHSSPAMTTS